LFGDFKPFKPTMKKYFTMILCLAASVLQAQTKVSGTVKDTDGFPIAFANVLFSGSTIGTITNDDGSFYLESEQPKPNCLFPS